MGRGKEALAVACRGRVVLTCVYALTYDTYTCVLCVCSLYVCLCVGGVLSLQRKIITSDLLGLATAEQRRMDNLNAR
jgi:hypothetical protein